MFPDEDWVHKSFLMLVWFEICLSCTSSYSSVLKNADINALFNYCYKEMVFDPSWDISGSSCGLGYGYSFAIEVEAICGEGGGLGVFSELFGTNVAGGGAALAVGLITKLHAFLSNLRYRIILTLLIIKSLYFWVTVKYCWPILEPRIKDMRFPMAASSYFASSL